jgi:hypothetical protein
MSEKEWAAEIMADYRKAVAGKPFRPPNGTAGMDFEAQWCDRCERDRMWNELSIDPCEIHNDAIANLVGEEGYPPQWVHDERGYPKCTAFIPLDGEIPQEPIPGQLGIPGIGRDVDR